MEEIKMATDGPKKAWNLHVNLLEALKNSDAFNSQNSMSYVYDILMGMGLFTTEILTALNAAIKLEEEEKLDIYDFYMNNILPSLRKDMNKVIPDLHAIGKEEDID